MKRKIAILLTLVALVLGSLSVWAATDSPAEFIANLKGINVDEAYSLRSNGQAFGEIADEEGVLQEFKDNMYNYRKEIVDQKVEEGVITREEADKYLEDLKARFEECDGTCETPEQGMGQGLSGILGRGYNSGNGLGRNSESCLGENGDGLGEGKRFGNKQKS